MPAATKFNQFVVDLGAKVHNLNADSLKIMLTLTAPVVTNSVKLDLTEIAAGNGYTAGGTVVASTAYTGASGTAKLVGNKVVFTAVTSSMAAFRYGVLYNDTPTSPADPLIQFWDAGVSVTLAVGESYTFAADSGGANWSSSIPLLTVV